MTNEVASIASAISASFSAIAAITIMLIQRKNMVDSAGPEIVLEGWERKRKTINKKEYDVLSFTKVANAGKGPALHVCINSINIFNNYPLTSFSTERISIIPSGKEIEINGEITLFFSNAAENGLLPINITIYCWSTQNVRYETTYRLIAVELEKRPVYLGGGQIATGVTLGTRSTKSVPVWKLKLNRYLARIPVIGKYFVFSEWN